MIEVLSSVKTIMEDPDIQQVMIETVKESHENVEEYDITCIKCGRSLSTDFDSGMTRTARQAHLIAKEVGFNSRGICPIGLAKSEEVDNE